MQRLPREATDRAAATLARAFSDDPLWLYLLDDRRRRSLALRQSFRATLPLYAGAGQLYGAGPDLAGVAVWRPPAASAGAAASLISWNMVALLFGPAGLALRRAFPIFGQFDRMHRQYAGAPHYYLATIGVAPEAQGRGLASRLIKPVLARADAEGRAAYTETMTPSNVSLYEHYGFVCQERYDLPAAGLSIWSFYRPAPEPGLTREIAR